MSTQKLKDGKYLLRNGTYRINLFFKLFGKEILLTIAIALCFLIELFVFIRIVPQTYLDLIIFSYFIVNIILIFLLVNIIFYNRKYPEKTSSNVFLLGLAIFFFNANYVIELSMYFNDTLIQFSDTQIYVCNFFIAIMMLSFLFIKFIRYKIAIRKGEAKSISRPTLLIYISSAFTLTFYSLSITNIAITSMTLISLYNLLFTILILTAIFIKSFLYKISVKTKEISKRSLKILLVVIIIFIGTNLITLWYIFTFTINLFNSENNIILTDIFPLFIRIWNLNFMNISIFIAIFSTIFLVFLHLFKGILLDWEEYVETE